MKRKKKPRRSLAKEETNKRNIEWQKTHNTALARKIRETNAVARSLPRLPLPRKRFTVQIVDPASASPIRNFEEELEKYEKELEEKRKAKELERNEDESEERNKPKRRRIKFLDEEEKTEETDKEKTEKTDKKTGETHEEKTGNTDKRKQKRKRKHSDHDKQERKQKRPTMEHSQEQNKEKNKEQNKEKNDSQPKRKRKRVSQLYQLEEKLDQNNEKDTTQKDINEPADKNELVELSLEDVLGFDPLDLELDLGLDLLDLDDPLEFDNTPPPQDPSSPSRCPAKTAASGAKADMSSVEPPPGLPDIASASSIGKPPSVNIS